MAAAALGAREHAGLRAAAREAGRCGGRRVREARARPRAAVREAERCGRPVLGCALHNEQR